MSNTKPIEVKNQKASKINSPALGADQIIFNYKDTQQTNTETR
ncbi:MAG TPA: hypothetical protein VER14_00600 [Phototrophicaceae bacterium]|nr:hypothetical protein [Phototrophicaceae bacterium]